MFQYIHNTYCLLSNKNRIQKIYELIQNLFFTIFKLFFHLTPQKISNDNSAFVNGISRYQLQEKNVSVVLYLQLIEDIKEMQCLTVRILIKEIKTVQLVITQSINYDLLSYQNFKIYYSKPHSYVYVVFVHIYEQ